MIKVVWGVTIGFIAWVMTSFAGIDGIKMMSNLGGLPALFIVLACNISLIYCVINGTFTKPKTQKNSSTLSTTPMQLD